LDFEGMLVSYRPCCIVPKLGWLIVLLFGWFVGGQMRMLGLLFSLLLELS